MLSPNIEVQQNENFAANWLFAGHSSSNIAQVAAMFSGSISSCELPDNQSDFSSNLKDVDAVALVINAKTGVSNSMIKFWQYVSERQFPRLVIVSGLELSDTDFDDIVLIANRVLEQTITPYLVLHDELGEPTGLIQLSTLEVHDYSSPTSKTYLADQELIELVADFKSEYEDLVPEFDDSGFVEGLLVPAIPLGTNREFGKSEIQRYLSAITKR